MTTDVKVLIAEFLRTHKRLVVPQLGAFIVKAPGGEILFSELFKRDDGVLRGLLTAAGASEIEAAGVAGDSASERELLYKILFDMRGDINDLKRMVSELLRGGAAASEAKQEVAGYLPTTAGSTSHGRNREYAVNAEVVEEPHEALTKADVQREQIIRALRRNNGRRREAAAELFMSERTLYRKIKELGIEDD